MSEWAVCAVHVHACVDMHRYTVSINVSTCVCMHVYVCTCACVCLRASRQISLSSIISIVCLVVHDQSVLDEIEAVWPGLVRALHHLTDWKTHVCQPSKQRLFFLYIYIQAIRTDCIMAKNDWNDCVSVVCLGPPLQTSGTNVPTIITIITQHK